MRRWIPLIATAIILPCLIALGFWQLDRSAQKLETRQLKEARQDAPPVALSGSSAHSTEDLVYRAVSARGEYRADGQILVDNQIHRGQAGYHVLTPLTLSGDTRTVLVNRGWVPWGPDRSVLPDAPVPAGQVEIQGRAVVPPAYFELETPDAKTTAHVWQNLDLGRYAKLNPGPLMPVVIELAESGGEGFVRQWRPLDDGWVERHQGYAFQWFALAITLVVINLVLWRRRIKD